MMEEVDEAELPVEWIAALDLDRPNARRRFCCC